MNSFKKIALAMSAALVGTLISVAPANAVPSVTTTAGTTVATAASVTVPADNKVEAADAVLFTVSSVETGSVVNVSATNAFLVTALYSVAAPVAANSGSTSLSINTGTGNSATFYAYVKSTTTTGSVVISNGGNTFTYYVKGTSATAYSFNVDLATNAATSSKVKAVVTVADVFGNAVAVAPTVTVFNATAGVVTADADIVGKYTVEITYPATAGKSAIGFSVAGVDSAGVAETKTKSVFVDVSDLAAENTKLKADLAAVQKALADEKIAHDATKASAVSAATAAAKAASDAAAALETVKTNLRLVKLAYNRMAKKFKFATIKL